jgi:hypothetical protein
MEQPTSTADNRSLAYPIFAAIVALGAVVATMLRGLRPIDDSFITFRVARNLAAGHGFHYNVGEPYRLIVGTSCPIYATVLAAFARLGVPLETAALVVGAICAAIVVYVGALAFLQLRPSWPVWALATILLALRAVWNAACGMETTFAMALVAAIALFVLRAQPPRAALFAAMLVGVRYETAFFALGLGAAWFFLDRKLAWRYVLVLVVALACGAGVLTLVAGSPLLSTALAKMHLYWHQTRPAHAILMLQWASRFTGSEWTVAERPYQIALAALICLGALLLGAVPARRTSPGPLILLTGLLAWFVGWMIPLSVLMFHWYRELMDPALLLVLVGVFVWVADWARRAIDRSSGGTPSALGSAIPGVLGLALAVTMFRPAVIDSFDLLTHQAYPRFAVYHAMADFLTGSVHDPADPVLVSELGIIGWYHAGTVVDANGLIWPPAVPFNREYLATGREPTRSPYTIPPALVRHFQPMWIAALDAYTEAIEVDPWFRAHYKVVWRSGSTLSEAGTEGFRGCIWRRD